MKTQNDKDMESISHYLREHEREDFLVSLMEGNLSPREGVDTTAWCARLDELGSLGKHHEDFWPKLDQVAADTEGHIYGAMVRVERELVDVPVHPDAGLGLFVVSGREHGDDDDTVDKIVAVSAQQANGIFEQMLSDQSEDDNPTIYLNTNTLIGVFDRQGKLDVGAKLPVVDKDFVQTVEPMLEDDGPEDKGPLF